MGFLKRKKEICPLCNKSITGILNPRFDLIDGYICQSCTSVIKGPWKAHQEELKANSFSEVRKMFNETLLGKGIPLEGGVINKNNSECPICDKELTKFSLVFGTLDGYKICIDHYTEVSLNGVELAKPSLYEIKERLKDKTIQEMNAKKNIDSFAPTLDIAGAIAVNADNGDFRLLDSNYSNVIFNLSSIQSYEIIENNDIVTSGGLGRAVVGAITFGGAGAVVGALTGRKQNSVVDNLKIKILLNSLEFPALYIELINKPIKKENPEYGYMVQVADTIISSLNTVINTSESNNENPLSSNIEHIREFKKLLDEGILTQEEFDTKKKELLGLH